MRLFAHALVIFLGLEAAAAQIKVVSIQGEVYVRYGVRQDWQRVRVGDLLKPEDSIRSGSQASTIILVDDSKKVAIPDNVVVDLSDFRKLTQEELLLKLAMERVRAVPTEEDGQLVIPQTTVIHGTEKVPAGNGLEPRELGLFQLNGTRVLYNNGYYATCVLRAKEVLRFYPEFLKRYDVRLMIASALEKESLRGEALAEYAVLAGEELSPKDQALVKSKIARLKKKT